jgi:hypothetical protein
MGLFGSCKTMLAVAIGVETAYRCAKIHEETGENRYAFLICYEPKANEVLRRTRSYAAEIHLQSLALMGEEHLSTTGRLKRYEKELFAPLIASGVHVPGEYERLQAVEKVLDEHLVPVDFTGGDKARPDSGTGYIEEIADRIEEELKQRGPGAKAEIVVVDYVGVMCELHLLATGRDDESPRKLIGQAPRLVRRMIASPFKTPVWLIHQLSGEANSHQDVTRRHHHEEAAECKHFGDDLNAMLIAGAQDPDHRFVIANSKAQDDASKEVLVRMQGEIGLVTELDDVRVNHHKWLPTHKQPCPAQVKDDSTQPQCKQETVATACTPKTANGVPRVTRSFKLRTGPNADTFHPELDSRQYLERSKRGHSKAKVEYHESAAYRMLRPGKSHSGLWLPDWLAMVSSDPCTLRMMGLVLFYYDDKGTRSAAVPRNRLRQSDQQQIRDIPDEKLLHRHQWCRAMAMRHVSMRCTVDGKDVVQTHRVRCLDKPLDKIAGAAGIPEKTARRVLKELVDTGVLIRPTEPGYKGILVYPNGHTLACRFLEHLGVPEEKWPEPLTSLVTRWYESEYRKQAMNRDGRVKYDLNAFDLDVPGIAPKPYGKPVIRGTWVDDLIYAACEERAGPAHLMAQLLWWFGGREDPRTGAFIPRAQLVREGRRWVAMSDRQIADAMGYPTSSVRGWLDWLVKKKFFKHEKWPWRAWNSSSAGISHYSPEPEAIYEAIHTARGRAKELRHARFEGFRDKRVGPEDMD